MAKLNFPDALERIADGQRVSREDVQAAALRRRVWIAEWHIPGCLSESFVVCITKDEAIESALLMAETSDGVPRGMKTALMRSGRFDCETSLYGRVINTIERRRLSDIL